MTDGQCPSGRGGPHAFVDDLAAPTLSEADQRHLGRSLRLRPGDPCTVVDGHGSWRPCRFGDPLEVDGPIVYVPEAESLLTVGFALIKGSRPELVVQKLTELGIDRIVPFVSERSIVRWNTEKRAHHHERWQRVALEAAMQSRRVRLPLVEPVQQFAAVAGEPGVHLADLGARAIGAGVTMVLVGPEGGWTDAERGDLPVVGLGPQVLRAETAALAAGVRLAAAREV